jgi:hypothetical protein
MSDQRFIRGIAERNTLKKLAVVLLCTGPQILECVHRQDLSCQCVHPKPSIQLAASSGIHTTHLNDRRRELLHIRELKVYDVLIFWRLENWHFLKFLDSRLGL